MGIRIILGCNLFRIVYPRNFHLLGISKIVLCQNSTDTFLGNLILEEASKRETNLSKYFENGANIGHGLLSSLGLKIESTKETENDITRKNQINVDLFEKSSANVGELVKVIESTLNEGETVPNNQLMCLLIYFAKHGIIAGVKAVQIVVKSYNLSDFSLNSEYKHYLAEALWINGQIEDSLSLFSDAYDNPVLRSQVVLRLKCLFPLLVTQYGHGTLNKTIFIIEQFSLTKRDSVILAYLWKELFQSNWFSDHQLAHQILEKHAYILQTIQWMIPGMGKQLLKDNKTEDYYRLLEFTLQNNLKPFGKKLIHLLFDYYYIHQNIERCSAVVKYCCTTDTPLAEDQERRYINLLLKSKNSVSAKSNIRRPRTLTYKF